MGLVAPILAIFILMFSIIFIIIGIPYLAGVPMIPAQSSANLTSTGANFSALIPFFALMVIGGIVIVSIEKSGK